MAHRVGHRDVQRLPIEREVERVAADLPGRLEPAGQRELIRLAGEGRGQQAALDLGRERQRDGALAPLEEVGVAPVGDHHVGELMGGQLDVLERGRSGLERQDQLEDADRLAAARHGRDDASAITLPQHDGALRGKCVAVGRAVQRHPHGGLLAARARFAVRVDVAQAVQRPAAEVRDQEAHAAGAEHLPHRGGHGIDDADRRRGLGTREQGTQIEPARRVHEGYAVIRDGPGASREAHLQPRASRVAVDDHFARKLVDEEHPPAHPGAVVPRCHPLAIVADDHEQHVGEHGRGDPHRPVAGVTVGVHHDIGQRLGDRDRDLPVFQRVPVAEIPDGVPPGRDAARDGRQLQLDRRSSDVRACVGLTAPRAF